MSRSSVLLPRAGEFRRLYRKLRQNEEVFSKTPVVFCEGDSWFSTPLSMNLLDWLVYPSPAAERQGVPIFGAGGLFYRAESSGALATKMFTEKGIKRLVDWYEGFQFDIVLLSAGGNDFVGTYLRDLFKGLGPMSVADAVAKVNASDRYVEVYNAYDRLISAFRRVHARTPILSHTYAYPIKMGVSGNLTLENTGVAGLIKDAVGPWIGNHISRALPLESDQRLFARALIDGFEKRVLRELKKKHTGVFDYVDLRQKLEHPSLWFDEMHPTGAGFEVLSNAFANDLTGRNLLALK